MRSNPYLLRIVCVLISCVCLVAISTVGRTARSQDANKDMPSVVNLYVKDLDIHKDISYSGEVDRITIYGNLASKRNRDSKSISKWSMTGNKIAADGKEFYIAYSHSAIVFSPNEKSKPHYTFEFPEYKGESVDGSSLKFKSNITGTEIKNLRVYEFLLVDAAVYVENTQKTEDTIKAVFADKLTLIKRSSKSHDPIRSRDDAIFLPLSQIKFLHSADIRKKLYIDSTQGHIAQIRPSAFPMPYFTVCATVLGCTGNIRKIYEMENTAVSDGISSLRDAPENYEKFKQIRKEVAALVYSDILAKEDFEFSDWVDISWPAEHYPKALEAARKRPQRDTAPTDATTTSGQASAADQTTSGDTATTPVRAGTDGRPNASNQGQATDRTSTPDRSQPTSPTALGVGAAKPKLVVPGRKPTKRREAEEGEVIISAKKIPPRKVQIEFYDPGRDGNAKPPAGTQSHQVAAVASCENWRAGVFVKVREPLSLPVAKDGKKVPDRVCLLIRTGDSAEPVTYCVVHPVKTGDEVWHIELGPKHPLRRFDTCPKLDVTVRFVSAEGDIDASLVQRYLGGRFPLPGDVPVVSAKELMITSGLQPDASTYEEIFKTLPYRGYKFSKLTSNTVGNKVAISVTLSPAQAAFEEIKYRFVDSSGATVGDCEPFVQIPESFRLDSNAWRKFRPEATFALEFIAGTVDAYRLASEDLKGNTLGVTDLALDTKAVDVVQLSFQDQKCSTEKAEITADEIRSGVVIRKVAKAKPSLTFMVVAGMDSNDKQAYNPLRFLKAWTAIVAAVSGAHDELKSLKKVGRSSLIVVAAADQEGKVVMRQPGAKMFSDEKRFTDGVINVLDQDRRKLRLTAIKEDAEKIVRNHKLQNGLTIVAGFPYHGAGELCGEMKDNAARDASLFGAAVTIYIPMAVDETRLNSSKEYLRPLNGDSKLDGLLAECLKGSAEGPVPTETLYTIVVLPQVGAAGIGQFVVEQIKQVILRVFDEI